MGVQRTDLTPNRLYSIANTYQSAAATIVASPGFSAYPTDGPARVLFYRACELYLKAFLLLTSTESAKLVLSPDLEALLEHAIASGLAISDTTEEFVRSAARDHDYEKARSDMDGVPSTTSLMLLVRAVIEVRADLRARLLAVGIEPGD